MSKEWHFKHDNSGILDLSSDENRDILDNVDNSNVTLSGFTDIQQIIFPSDLLIVNSVALKNLPSVEKISFVINSRKFPVRERLLSLLGETGVFWISLENLPALKSLEVTGEIYSIDIDDAPVLADIKLGSCPNLEHLSLTKTQGLKSIDLIGCIKLRGVTGPIKSSNLARMVDAQILQVQMRGVTAAVKNKFLSHLEIDAGLNLINEALKALNRSQAHTIKPWSGTNGKISCSVGSIFGSMGASAYDREYKPLSIFLLPPDAEVYSGGNRCTHYLSDLSDWENQQYPRNSTNYWQRGSWYSNGCIGAEASLERALSCVGTDLYLSGYSARWSERRLWNSLEGLIGKYPYDGTPEVSIYIDKSIAIQQRAGIESICARLGFDVCHRVKKHRVQKKAACLHVVPDIEPFLGIYGESCWRATRPITAQDLLREFKIFEKMRQHL